MEITLEKRNQLWTNDKYMEWQKGNMTKALTQEVKDRLKNLQQQKDDLKEDLEMVTYSKNLRKVEQIEQEIYEIDDTMKKLRGE